MPIYKQDESGKFVPFEETPFPDLEKVLEDWIERNPHLVLDGEVLAIISRQPRTAFGRYLDLLAVDKTGATVVIELKRGETPRDVLAQTLEYAAWVDSLTFEQLDDMAREYAESRGLDASGVADLYRRTFSVLLEEPDAQSAPVTDTITFNSRQRLVIIAEHILREVEQTLRYLRTRFGADVYGVTFSVHKAGGDTIISTNTVVGREQVGAGTRTPPQAERESDESIHARVKSDFLREAVYSIEEWVANSGIDGLTVDHSTAGSGHFIRYLGSTWVYYEYAANHLYMNLYGASPEESETLRSHLSNPEKVKPIMEGKYLRFHVVNNADLQVLKDLVLTRVAARRQAAG